MLNGDLGRFSGYDPCGNVCGQKNSKYNKWECSGADFTSKPLLQYSSADKTANWEILLLSSRECVAHCHSDYDRIANSCFRRRSTADSYDYFNNRYKRSDVEEEQNPEDTRVKRAVEVENLDEIGKGISDYLNKHSWRIVLACFISLAVAIGMLVLFKTATAAVVWAIIGGVLLFGAVVIGLSWYTYFNIEKWVEETNDVEGSKRAILFIAIFFTVFILVLFCMTVFMYKKIQLVIQLLKEATKAAFSMPLLVFVPIITFIAELIVIVLVGFTTAYMLTAGSLTEVEGTTDFLYYKQNGVMAFTLIFNLIVALWSTQFIIGIQYMVIAGAVATWYWSKNKNYLGSPISSSAKIVFSFHLGSIAFGSLIITIIAIIRALLTSLTKNKSLKAIVDFCIGAIESFLKFLSKNAYILIAMHGKPFFKSGKRAAKIIWQNAVNIVSINYVGDFVLGMAQLLIVLISMLITVGIMQGAEGDYAFIVYIIVFFVSLFVAVTSFSIFETTIDTIFLCFCEDSLLNDGMARPYAMSRDLMEFVENSKKLYGEKKD